MYSYDSIGDLTINLVFWFSLGLAGGFVIGSIVKHINEH